MIPVKIIPQGYELIRDRIMSIIVSEFENQATNFYNTDCENVKFFAERTVPPQQGETPVINIATWKAEYGNKELDYVDGTYKYAIEIITSAPTNSTTKRRGDELAGIKLQRLMSIVRYILEDSIYCTLLFDPPFILHTEVSMWQVLKFDQVKDATASVMGQIIFTVRCGETTEPMDAPLIAGNTTEVKIDISDKGYQYVYGVASPNLPPDPRYVYIKDQFGNVLEQLPGGTSYTIEVLKEIIQTLAAAPGTIIQTLS